MTIIRDKAKECGGTEIFAKDKDKGLRNTAGTTGIRGLLKRATVTGTA